MPPPRQGEVMKQCIIKRLLVLIGERSVLLVDIVAVLGAVSGDLTGEAFAPLTG
jgi:hypothetical protein